MISAKWSINLNNNKKVTMQLPMSVVVIYNEFINETLNFVNEYIHIYTYIHIRRPIKFNS